MSVKEEVHVALSELAASDSPDDIAATMRALHIKGRPGSGMLCPVAVYLSDRIACSFGEIAVNRTCVSLLTPHMIPGFKTVSTLPLVELPPAVQRFIVRFDNHDYPDLELP